MFAFISNSRVAFVAMKCLELVKLERTTNRHVVAGIGLDKWRRYSKDFIEH